MLSKEVSRTIFWVFDMTRPGIETRSPGPLANTLTARLMDRAIGLMSRVFTNDPGDRGSIPGPVIPKTQKWYLMPPGVTLSIIRYGLRVKWNNPGKEETPFPTHRCNSYWKGAFGLHSTTSPTSLTLYIKAQYIYIYIYLYIYIYIYIV